MKLSRRSILRRAIGDISWSFIYLPLFTVLLFGIGEADFVLEYVLAFFIYYLSRVVAQGIYWTRSSYSIEEGCITMKSGVLNIRTRTVPVEKVQEVNVVQGWLDALLGLTTVSFETAGSKTNGEIELRYVRGEDAERIRNELKDQAEWPGESDATQTTLYHARLRVLIFRGLTSLHLKYVLIGVLGITSVATAVVSFPIPGIPVLNGLASRPLLSADVALVGGVVLALVWLFGLVVTILKFYDLTITRTGDRLHSRAGLWYNRSSTVPLEKVHLVRISSNLLQRALDYAVLTVSSAGMAENIPFPFREPLIPLEKTDTVETVAKRILPYRDAALEGPPKRMRRRYLLRFLIVTGVLTAVSFAVTSLWLDTTTAMGTWPLLLLPAGPVFAHLNWRSRGIAIHDNYLVLRRGAVRQHTYIVPLNRIQQISVSRSVFQRRADLATISIETASPVHSIGLYGADFDIQTVTSIQRKLRESGVGDTGEREASYSDETTQQPP